MKTVKHVFQTIARWVDSSAGAENYSLDNPQKVDWVRVLPFAAMHLMCFGVIWVGVSWPAVAAALALYYIRMFAITGWYHRYFSHRTFRTSRACQFAFAALGNAAVQRGPLWWAAHHRHHHRHSDQEADIHSPRQHGFWWSHVGWITSVGNFHTNYKAVPDLAKFPELRFLDRFDWLVPVLLAAGLYFGGEWLAHAYPQLGTGGMQMLIWAFFLSTVLLFHTTFVINSLAHLMGGRRYQTKDDSRNSMVLALLTMGEGWHNNHHYYPGTVRQGFYWWEIDVTWYILVAMSWLGLIWDLRPVPHNVLSGADAEHLSTERATGSSDSAAARLSGQSLAPKM